MCCRSLNLHESNEICINHFVSKSKLCYLSDSGKALAFAVSLSNELPCLEFEMIFSIRSEFRNKLGELHGMSCMSGKRIDVKSVVFKQLGS